LQNGTESAEKADHFYLEWMVGGYWLKGLEKKHVQLLEQRKRDYMTGRVYTEESDFARATHHSEGENGMLLASGWDGKKASLYKWFCLPVSKQLGFSF
jgi:hypothetical protein